ncbi:MAG: hypothetical protein ACK2UW_00675 [Anaerolineales bacterium]|jgi:hypothetical protein
MQIISNERLIKRNARVGQIASIVGLGVLVVGMIISFTRPDLFIWSLLALLVGFALSQIGIYFGNRWGRRPRPDEVLDAALKGLDGNFRLYHYSTPAAHLLTGPAGVWVLLTRMQRGKFVFEKGRWRQKGGGFLQAYMRIFAQEGVGRPDLEAPSEVEAVKKFLNEKLPDEELPVNAILVFTNDSAEFEENDEAFPPAVTAKKLKDFIRKEAKNKPISIPMSKTLQDALD